MIWDKLNYIASELYLLYVFFWILRYHQLGSLFLMHALMLFLLFMHQISWILHCCCFRYSSKLNPFVQKSLANTKNQNIGYRENIDSFKNIIFNENYIETLGKTCIISWKCTKNKILERWKKLIFVLVNNNNFEKISKKLFIF